MRAAARYLAGVFLVAGVALWAWPALRVLRAAPAAQRAGSPAAVATFLAPQGGPAAEAHSAQSSSEKPSLWTEVFHWFNFLLIVWGLAWLVRKFMVPFFLERGRLIREEMNRSAKVLAEAEQRLSAVESSLARLSEELAKLRRDALAEISAESARIEQAAQQESEKALQNAAQDIEAALKTARWELRRYASELALSMAERKIRDSLTPQVEQRILHSFVHELASRGGGANGKLPADCAVSTAVAGES